MYKFVTKNRINKKLCIDCQYCNIYDGGALRPTRHMCSLEFDPLDGTEKHFARIARTIPWICGGTKWVINKDIKIVETKEESQKLDYEQQLQTWMPTARNIVANGRNETYATCGFLEEAIQRVKEENEISWGNNQEWINITNVIEYHEYCSGPVIYY